MTKKDGVIDVYPGLRLLRSLTLGYQLTPFQGFRMEADLLLQTSARWATKLGLG
jgi:hypothetical protein